MSLGDPVLWTIQRVRMIADGAGGKIAVPQSQNKRVLGCLLRKRQTRSEERLEDGAHNSPGPGLQTLYRRIVSFRPPFPTLVVDEQLVAPDGTTYIVHDVRDYGWSLQVDVEVDT